MAFFRSLVLLLAIGATVGACVPLPDRGGPVGRYRLTAPLESGAQEAQSRIRLSIEEPAAERALDSALIAVARTPNRFEYYRDVEWSDRAPIMVQAFLIRTFENSGRFAFAGRRGEGVRSDLRLTTELRRFEADAIKHPDSAHVAIYAKLVDPRRGDILDARLFETRRLASSAAVAAMVEAFDLALSELAVEMVDWSYRLGMEAETAGRLALAE